MHILRKVQLKFLLVFFSKYRKNEFHVSIKAMAQLHQARIDACLNIDESKTENKDQLKKKEIKNPYKVITQNLITR